MALKNEAVMPWTLKQGNIARVANFLPSFNSLDTVEQDLPDFNSLIPCYLPQVLSSVLVLRLSQQCSSLDS